MMVHGKMKGKVQKPTMWSQCGQQRKKKKLDPPDPTCGTGRVPMGSGNPDMWATYLGAVYFQNEFIDFFSG